MANIIPRLSRFGYVARFDPFYNIEDLLQNFGKPS
ncbi:hypothetical protein SAMN05216316_2961 [Nitrosovibrio sp. Nv6]|nr:hypothetical protein SAMN05216316_2961 [Nitrosovibrio sp. Nv6]